MIYSYICSGFLPVSYCRNCRKGLALNSHLGVDTSRQVFPRQPSMQSLILRAWLGTGRWCDQRNWPRFQHIKVLTIRMLAKVKGVNKHKNLNALTRNDGANLAFYCWFLLPLLGHACLVHLQRSEEHSRIGNFLVPRKDRYTPGAPGR